MAAKITEVELESELGRRSFAIDHAERILNLRNCAWKLPEDSEFELKEDGTLSRRDKNKGK